MVKYEVNRLVMYVHQGTKGKMDGKLAGYGCTPKINGKMAVSYWLYMYTRESVLRWALNQVVIDAHTKKKKKKMVRWR